MEQTQRKAQINISPPSRRQILGFAIVRAVVREVFQWSYVVYILLLVLDQLVPGFVSNSFNLNSLFIITLISGILTAATSSPEEQTTGNILSRSNLWVIGGSALVGGAIVFSKVNSIGSFRFVVSLLTAVLIFALGWLLLSSADND